MKSRNAGIPCIWTSLNGWWHRFGSIVYVRLFTFLLHQRGQLSFGNSYFYRFLCHHPLITQLTPKLCNFDQKFKMWLQNNFEGILVMSNTMRDRATSRETVEWLASLWLFLPDRLDDFLNSDQKNWKMYPLFQFFNWAFFRKAEGINIVCEFMKNSNLV